VSEDSVSALKSSSRVTEIKRKRGRVTFIFDSAEPLECDRNFEIVYHFAIGDVIDCVILDRLRNRALVHTAETIAEKLLTRRPRSESELLSQLRHRGVQISIAKEVAASLRERGLIDDMAFAKYWTEERVRTRPRSGRKIKAELRAKGIPESIAVDATASVSDDELATQLARKAAQKPQKDWASYERRVGNMLVRRGFTHTTALRALRTAWESQENCDLPEEP
jgi:regulatory protein